jgi:hypothetical protein
MSLPLAKGVAALIGSVACELHKLAKMIAWKRYNASLVVGAHESVPASSLNDLKPG